MLYNVVCAGRRKLRDKCGRVSTLRVGTGKRTLCVKRWKEPQVLCHLKVADAKGRPNGMRTRIQRARQQRVFHDNVEGRETTARVRVNSIT